MRLGCSCPVVARESVLGGRREEQLQPALLGWEGQVLALLHLKSLRVLGSRRRRVSL